MTGSAPICRCSASTMCCWCRTGSMAVSSKEMLAAIFDNLAEVAAIHPVAKQLKLETARGPTAVPYHPAAIEFYKSRGVTMN